MFLKQKFPRAAGAQFSSKTTQFQGFQFGFGSLATSFGFGFAAATFLFGFWFSKADAATELQTTSWIEADANTATTESMVWNTATQIAESWMPTTRCVWLAQEDAAWLETESTWMWSNPALVRWNTLGPSGPLA